MNSIDNNQFEVKPNSKTKRKITTPCPNVYLNPALDLLANEDPMCNTAMEIVPNKKRKCTKSCEITAFENTGLDLGISKAAVNEFLVRELENVRKNMKSQDMSIGCSENMIGDKENISMNFTGVDNVSIAPVSEPIYANLTDMSDSCSLCPDESVNNVPSTNTAVSCFEPRINNETTDQTMDLSCIPTYNRQAIPGMELSCFHPDISEIEMDSGISVLEQKSVTATSSVNNILENDTDISMDGSNIQRTVTNQVIINNTSNINLSFIDRLALDSPNLSNQSLYLDDDLNESNIMEVKTITIITKKKRIVNKKKNTNPFLDPNINETCNSTAPNPFLSETTTKPELEYNEEAINRPVPLPPVPQNLMPRRLFSGNNNSTISTVNESIDTEQNEYENIDSYRAESPIYENVSGEFNDAPYNKQSKILGHDVSRFSAVDILNLNKHSETNCSNESNDSKKDLKHQILKAGNKLSKKVFKTIKKTFKHDKVEHNATLNPYEVPRKLPKQKVAVPKESGIENPALNLDNSDEIEIEELDDDDEEHQYETIKTLRNTRLNMNVTPLKERGNDNADCSQNRPNTPGKKVRFDSTLNQEKVITGNSFDYGIQSPGFDAKIDKYHDELENCINERKFLQQNM